MGPKRRRREEKAQELAKQFLAAQMELGTVYTHWRDTWYEWRNTHYYEIDDNTMLSKVGLFGEAKLAQLMVGDDVPSFTRNFVKDVVAAIARYRNQPANLEAPFPLNNLGPQGQCVTFLNGVLNITKLLAGDPEAWQPGHDHNWFSLTCLPFNYDPAALCPRFDAFLDQTFESDSETVDFLHEWFGYNCVVDYQFQHFVVCTGEGQVGKSTLLEVMHDLLGKANVSPVPYQLFADRFSLATTIGKLANIAGEIDGASSRAENTIKEYTGGGTLYVDIKGKTPVNLRPTARLTFACNKVPTFWDKSRGMRRRAIIVPFNRQVPDSERDTQLAAKLKAELPGVFNRALEGLKRLYQRGHFAIPQRCQDAIDAHVLESNPALQFLSDLCELADGALISADYLWTQYKDWYRTSGPFEDQLRNKAQFGRDVKVWSKGKVEREQRRAMGKRGYFYVGLRYLGEEQEAAA